MKKRKLCAVLVLVLLIPVPSQSEVHLRLTEGIDNPAPLANMQFGASLTEILLFSDDPSSSLGILVGSPAWGASADRGRISFWFGGTDLSLSPDLDRIGDFPEHLGFSVARAGDLNNDGYDDFAVGAPTYSLLATNDGRVYVFYGGPSIDMTEDAILEGFQNYTGYTGHQFGHSVWSAGDFNGDGDDDLIVGAPFANAPGIDQGAAFIYYGPISGTTRTPDLILTGEIAGDNFGWSVCDAGNFLGGNEVSLAVGAPNHSLPGLDAGAVYIFEGSVGGTPNSTSDLKLISNAGSPAQGRFGFVVRNALRWNSDSYDDLVVGAPNYPGSINWTQGRIELFFGGNPPDSGTDRHVVGELARDHFGYSLDGVGDVRGNQYDDILIGAPGNDASGFNSGRAYLYEGNTSSGVTDAGSLFIIPSQPLSPTSEPDDFFGAWVSSAGDVDGDGQGDLAIGSPYGNLVNNMVAGFVLLLDTSGTVTPNFLMDWSSAWTVAGQVHLEFRLSTPVTDVNWLSVTREVLLDEESVLPQEVIFDGPAIPGTGPLEIQGETWILQDHPEPLPESTTLAYSLQLLLHDGQEINLPRLAGPASRPLALWPELRPPHPNPFNPLTVISFRAPLGQESVCRVVDMRGWHVATLFSGLATGQWQEVQWGGLADDGRSAPSGIYLVQLICGDMSTSRRIMMAK